MAVVDLPSEIIVQILSCLPSESLLRFQSVCKSWRSLISSTQFKLTHLHRFNQLNSRHLVRRIVLMEDKEAYTVHSDDQYFNLDTSFPIQFPFKLHRSEIGISFYKIIGCCNGVICLSDDKSRRDEIILWNPSIRRKLTLIPPMYGNSYSRDLFLVFGFGCIKMSDDYDYKVVRLAYDCRSITTPQVEIYTVKTAIWKAIQFPSNFPCFSIFPNWTQVFFNGSVHWIACDWSVSHCSILTFDMNTELFGEIQLPEYVVHESPMRLGIIIVGDSLGVIYSRRFSASSSYVIWVMKEYKNPTSWTMMYNVYYPDIDAGRALGLRNNGDLMMESIEGNLTIYNEEGCYFVYDSCNRCVVSDSIFVDRYQESLALLEVGSLG